METNFSKPNATEPDLQAAFISLEIYLDGLLTGGRFLK